MYMYMYMHVPHLLSLLIQKTCIHELVHDSPSVVIQCLPSVCLFVWKIQYQMYLHRTVTLLPPGCYVWRTSSKDSPLLMPSSTMTSDCSSPPCLTSASLSACCRTLSRSPMSLQRVGTGHQGMHYVTQYCSGPTPSGLRTNVKRALSEFQQSFFEEHGVYLCAANR